MTKPYLLGLYEKSMPNDYSLRQKLEAAKTAGYDYLELSIDETDEKLTRLDWSTAEIDALRRDMAETGIPVKSICLSGHRRYPLGDPDSTAREKGLAIMEKAVVLAAALGVRIIQLAGYDVYYKEGSEQTRTLFGENLQKSADLAAREGVLLGFETMETPFMDTVEKSMFWVNEVHSPYLHVYPDIGNLTNAALLYHGDVSADLMTGAGHLAALHLKETRPGVYREVGYGEGHVDFAGGIRTAWQLGVRMFVGEFWYLGEADTPAVLRGNCEFLRRVIGEGAREV